MLAIAVRLKGSGIRYLVIDAGWYQGATGNWGNGHGDWIPSRELFPHGLKTTADAIRERGLIPGLWFETETVGSASAAWHRTDLLLKRDGIPITVRERRFWDLNNAEAIAFLTEKIIGLLRDCGFGYPCRGTPEQVGTTFGAQSTFVLPIAGSPDAFIFMADRWRPDNAIDGRYVWLPVRFDAGGVPYLEWMEEWNLGVFER